MIRRLVRRLEREVRLAEAAHRRAVLILVNQQYECVGGPFDGELILWRQPQLSKYVRGGAYTEGPDHRMHFEQLASIFAHDEDPEC